MSGKFNTIQENVLFNIARARRKVNVLDIQKLSGNTLNKKQIFSAINSLVNRGLVTKKDELVSLNKKNLERVKITLGENWESNWENEWRANGF